MGKRLSGFGLISVCVVISVNVIAQPHFFNDQTQLGPINKNIYGTLKVVVFSSNPTYQWQVNKNDGNGFVHINSVAKTL